MDSSDFLELLRALTHLTATQLDRTQQHIRHHLQSDLLRQSLSECRDEEQFVCPHCNGVHIIHWGQSHSRHRSLHGFMLNLLGGLIARVRL